MVYRAGLGCTQSDERAVEWLAKAASSKAAEQGHAEAQCELSNAYLTGKGVPKSYERAVELFKLGEAQGHGQATADLAMGHVAGQGVDHSVAKARRLFELAAARGAAGDFFK